MLRYLFHANVEVDLGMITSINFPNLRMGVVHGGESILFSRILMPLISDFGIQTENDCPVSALLFVSRYLAFLIVFAKNLCLRIYAVYFFLGEVS